MDFEKFPRWSGPIVGAAVGLVLGLVKIPDFGEPGAFAQLGAFAAVGLLAGGLILVLDPPAKARKPRPIGEALNPYFEPEEDRSGRGLVGRTLTALGLLLFWVPVIGLVLSVAAILVHRLEGTRVGRLERIAAILGLVITAGVAVLLILEGRGA